MLEDETKTGNSPQAGESKIWGASSRFWLALLPLLTVCGMALVGKEVTEPLYTISVGTIGYYFGNVSRHKVNQ